MFPITSITRRSLATKRDDTFSTSNYFTQILDENMDHTEWCLLDDGNVADSDYAELANLPSKDFGRFLPQSPQTLGRYVTLRGGSNDDSIPISEYDFSKVEHLIITPTWTKDLVGVEMPRLISVTFTGDFTGVAPIRIEKIKADMLHLCGYKNYDPFVFSAIDVFCCGITKIRLTRTQLTRELCTHVMRGFARLDVLMVGTVEGSLINTELVRADISEALVAQNLYASDADIKYVAKRVSSFSGKLKCRCLVSTSANFDPSVFAYVDSTSVEVFAHRCKKTAMDKTLYTRLPNLSKLISPHQCATNLASRSFKIAHVQKPASESVGNTLLSSTLNCFSKQRTYYLVKTVDDKKYIIYCVQGNKPPLDSIPNEELGGRTQWDYLAYMNSEEDYNPESRPGVIYLKEESDSEEEDQPDKVYRITSITRGY